MFSTARCSSAVSIRSGRTPSAVAAAVFRRGEAVWIDGVQQSLENRQTRLRDRYRQPQEGALPHAYER